MLLANRYVFHTNIMFDIMILLAIIVGIFLYDFGFYKDITTITVNPTPGLLVKTRRLLGGKEKAFIMLMHHPQVRLEPPSIASAGISTEKVYQLSKLSFPRNMKSFFSGFL